MSSISGFLRSMPYSEVDHLWVPVVYRFILREGVYVDVAQCAQIPRQTITCTTLEQETCFTPITDGDGEERHKGKCRY